MPLLFQNIDIFSDKTDFYIVQILKKFKMPAYKNVGKFK